MFAQTTQGLIAGRISDGRSGAPLGGVGILYQNRATNSTGYVISSARGYYSAVLLPPGIYRLRASKDGYQAQEVRELEVAVAARLEIDFRLRPLSEVWESGLFRSVLLPESDLVVTFFGPDLDSSRAGQFVANRGRRGALESTLSQAIDPLELRELPFAGRDTYTMLITLPGVTAEAGAVRGLGLSINGQRTSASNFLLDGVENNNTLVTGPLAAAAPEAVSEYRVSTNNFTAEYGRTSGYVANAVTRAGGNDWHGLGYFNLKNEVLNANAFQRNALGRARSPLKEFQFGGQTGGRLIRDRLFASFAVERLRTRGFAEEYTANLPATGLWSNLAPGSVARRLLDQYPAVVRPESPLLVAPVELRPPASLDRTLALARVDGVFGKHRATARYSAVRIENPEFIWTPYPDFVSGLSQPVDGGALAVESTLAPGLANEFRFGLSYDSIAWERANPEVPSLFEGSFATALPGSPAFYGFSNAGYSLQVSDGAMRVRGAHISKAGGGFFWRNPGGELTAGRDGQFSFENMQNFILDKPDALRAAVDRAQLPRFRQPDYSRAWTQRQWFLFAQDTWRIAPGLVMNYGLRYDAFGSPSLVGRDVYGGARNGWQPRIGLSWSPRPGWLLRGAYGIFADRPFDNLWQNTRNNSWTLASLAVEGRFGYDYLAPLGQQLPQFEGQRFADDFPALTRIDAGLRNAYAQTWFAGIETRPHRSLTVEANTTGSLGRALITTDALNRGRRDDPSLPEISWRSNQGSSSYLALHGVVRWRHARGFVQGAYTWSHAIDNQSEPLAGDFFDLNFTRAAGSQLTANRARFDRVGDSSGDFGSADFDQRHNFVVLSSWEWRGFRVSEIAAFRTGFPYTVQAFDRRAETVGRALVSQPVAGGVRLLDAAAFRYPGPNAFGNLGRNSFAGPGLFNVDLSVARAFRFGERFRATVRADAYNVLNHANLGPPESSLFSPDFGVARYGRRGRDTGFPGVLPLAETARQVQLILRVEF